MSYIKNVRYCMCVCVSHRAHSAVPDACCMNRNKYNRLRDGLLSYTIAIHDAGGTREPNRDGVRLGNEYHYVPNKNEKYLIFLFNRRQTISSVHLICPCKNVWFCCRR